MKWKNLPLTTKIFLLPGMLVCLAVWLGMALGAGFSPDPADDMGFSAPSLGQNMGDTIEVPAQEMIDQFEQNGYSCSDEPALVDSIVFTWMDGGVEALTFDEAWDAAKSGKGMVRAYCSKN